LPSRGLFFCSARPHRPRDLSSHQERGSPGTIALDRATPAPDLFDWAQFHNGVATGLRLVAAESQESGSGGEAITSTWIAYNRPNELSNEHAGFLMALGLQVLLLLIM
jgi:anaphase-promoting complex subunit 1